MILYNITSIYLLHKYDLMKIPAYNKKQKVKRERQEHKWLDTVCEAVRSKGMEFGEMETDRR